LAKKKTSLYGIICWICCSDWWQQKCFKKDCWGAMKVGVYVQSRNKISECNFVESR
jgi:hypothetical protein